MIKHLLIECAYILDIDSVIILLKCKHYCMTLIKYKSFSKSTNLTKYNFISMTKFKSFLCL